MTGCACPPSGIIRYGLPFICLVMLMTSQIAETKIVSTLNGDIDGLTETVNEVEVDAYLGIPFAQPPVGDLRFRAPVPAQNWTGVKMTRTQPNSCMQLPDTMFNRFEGVEMWNTNTTVSEDCLYLNIWVPRSQDGAKLTTMVWIYGGSYVYGSNTLDIYNGKYLATKTSVIVASMQYRMGVMGFLYTKTNDAPGNMGLWDQQLAVKWIHDNIEAFGGDKDSISLFGESAGSSSINIHLLAPPSMPYFNNAIMLSASAMADWAVVNPDDLYLKSRTFASVMKCDEEDIGEVVKCLKKADAFDIENKQWELSNTNIGTFSPTVDGVFLPNFPTYLVKSGNIKNADIIIGNTKDEGEYFLVYFYTDVFKEDKLWSVPVVNRSQYLDIASRISSFNPGLGLDAVLYTYEKSVLQSQRGTYWDRLEDMLGDRKFICPVRKFAIDHTNQVPNKGRTFTYSFEYRHSQNPWPGYMGVLHGYEIEMLFGMPFNSQKNYSNTDRIVSEMMMDYFTAFAKTGNPNNSSERLLWPVFTENSEEHIVFTQEATSEIRHGYRTKECSFWDELAPVIRKIPGTSGLLPVSGASIPTSTYIDMAACSLLIVIQCICKLPYYIETHI